MQHYFSYNSVVGIIWIRPYSLQKYCICVALSKTAIASNCIIPYDGGIVKVYYLCASVHMMMVTQWNGPMFLASLCLEYLSLQKVNLNHFFINIFSIQVKSERSVKLTAGPLSWTDYVETVKVMRIIRLWIIRCYYGIKRWWDQTWMVLLENNGHLNSKHKIRDKRQKNMYKNVVSGYPLCEGDL